MKNTIYLVVLLLGPISLFAQGTEHPLDPLTWQEYWTVLEVLQDEARLDSETRFSMVNLKEPSKDVVRQWSRGDRIPRSAFALVRQEQKTYEAVVDLIARRLESWTEMEGIEPNWLEEEFVSIVGEVKKDAAFIEAMRRRGIENLTFIDCLALPPGYFNTEEQRNRRIAHVSCQDVRSVRNTWTRQIEGLTVVVDMDAREVIRVVDEGVVPIPTVSADYDRTSVGRARSVPGPLNIDQPLGPGFEIDGHQVEWQKWRFHVRPDQRVGMILSTVTYQDGDETRPVLYQGHLSEIFVPYMDPSFSWHSRNFLDAGGIQRWRPRQTIDAWARLSGSRGVFRRACRCR